MKVISVYVWVDHHSGVTQASATIEVPNLGKVELKHALTEETINRICAESQAALRVQLGQVLVENKSE